MKRMSLIILVALSALLSSAQYNTYNSTARTAIVLYKLDAQGFYQRSSNVAVDNVDNVVNHYAYDKKNKKLYVTTKCGNYVITLSGEMEKAVKKNKSIPQLKQEQIQELIAQHSSELDRTYAHLNEYRENQINDSIAQVREREKRAALERERQAREKARQDSIVQAQAAARAAYRAQHEWYMFPIDQSLNCSLCDKHVSGYSNDSIFVISMVADTIYSIERKAGLLDDDLVHDNGIMQENVIWEIHAYPVPSALKESQRFKYHVEAFSDSISAQKPLTSETAREMNSYYLSRYVEQVKKAAPSGLFVDWGWDADYSMVTFEMEFLNLDKRTIKYLDVYWNLYNDVDDLRGSGHFKGTGPVEQYQTGSWEWDSSMYFVAGDASWMKFTKVIITYMNGQKQVLTGKKIIY